MKFQATNLSTDAGISSVTAIVSLQDIHFSFDTSTAFLRVHFKIVEGGNDIPDIDKRWEFGDPTWTNTVLPRLKGTGNMLQAIRNYVKNRITDKFPTAVFTNLDSDT